MWKGDTLHLLKLLVLKDFKIRYRNMSLGIFWSLLNPIVMISLYVFVFTRIFRSRTPHFPLFLLCGLIPYSFFSMAWSSATGSIVDNASLVKRIPVRREIFPVASVIANLLHLGLQLVLLLVLVLWFGVGFSLEWLWLPLVWGLEVIFVIGVGMITAAVNVYIRDTRYVVESTNMVLFWLVPIFYGFEMIPAAYRELYQFNPVAALVMASRNIILEAKAPPATLLWKLALVSSVSLVCGTAVFRVMKRRFYSHI